MNEAKISFLGPQGTNSEFAALQYDSNAQLIASHTMYEAMMNVENGVSEFAVCAIENSLEGSVNEVIDILINPKYDLKIFSELVIKINHLLVGKSDVDLNKINAIYSHPQALAQCRESIIKLGKQINLIASTSTAAAVESAMFDDNACAIASSHAAKQYNAKVYKKDFADNLDNFTRFVVIGKSLNSPTGNDKTSIAFTTQHDRPGSLVEILKLFSSQKLNLTKIESRPTKSKLGTYVFLVDVYSHCNNEPLKSVISEITEIADWIKILGSYPMID